MIPIRATIDSTAARKLLGDLLARGEDFTPAMEGPVRQLVKRAIVQQFQTRGAYGGTPWPVLAESTIKRKQRAGVVGKGPLKFSEELYFSLTKIGHPLRRETITKRGYSLRSLRQTAPTSDGTRYGLAGIHQEGLGTVPARPIVPEPMPASFMRDLRKIVKAHLIEVQFGPGRSRVR